MELLQLMGELNEQNKTGKGYQIHLNSGNLEDNGCKITGIEFCDLYFSECRLLHNSTLLCFDNSTCQPVGEKEDGTKLYPQEINSSLMIDINKIEVIERVENPNDWFELPSEKIINLYMSPEDDTVTGRRNIVTGHRNIVSIGFME